MLLVEYDSLYVAALSPKPTVLKLADRAALYVAGHDGEGKGIDIKAGEAAVMSGRGVWCTVTVARGDRRRPTLRAYNKYFIHNNIVSPNQ